MDFDPEQLPMPDLGALCRQCGYPLRGLPEHCCPECGWRFTLDDLIPRGEMPPVRINAQPVPVTDAVRRVLDLQELPFEKNVLSAMYGAQIMSGRNSQLYLCVDRRYYFHAIHQLLVAEAEGRLDDPRPYIRPPPKPAGPAWRCGGCGEENPGNFEICWNCMAERPP